MLILALSLLAATPAASSASVVADTTDSVTNNGVTFPRKITVDGHELVLNGTALRKKFIVKVYVAGLYLAAPATDGDAILAADSPRRIVLQFVRGVDKGKMCGAWDEALANNTPNASEQLKGEFATLCGWMEDIEKTQQFVFTYIPGTGTAVDVKGVRKGVIAGKEFADALFNAWIGPKPGPGDGFKKQLLGVK